MDRVLLSQIDPEAFARRFARIVIGQIYQLEIQLFGPSFRPHSPEPQSTEIYRVVRDLTAYARGERALAAPERDYLIALAPLYGSMLGAGICGEPEDESPDTTIGVVIHSAIAREQLSRRTAITSVRFAALSGVAHDAVERLIVGGELRASRDEFDGAWLVNALAATRWLAEHAPT